MSTLLKFNSQLVRFKVIGPISILLKLKRSFKFNSQLVQFKQSCKFTFYLIQCRVICSIPVQVQTKHWFNLHASSFQTILQVQISIIQFKIIGSVPTQYKSRLKFHIVQFKFVDSTPTQSSPGSHRFKPKQTVQSNRFRTSAVHAIRLISILIKFRSNLSYEFISDCDI